LEILSLPHSLVQKESSPAHSFFQDIFKSLGKIEENNECLEFDLLDCTCNYLLAFLYKVFAAAPRCKEIAVIISSKCRNFRLNIALNFAATIDKEYMSLLVESTKYQKGVERLEEIRDLIMSRSKEMLETFKNKYNNTATGEFPEIQEVLCLGLMNLVKLSLNKSFSNALTQYLEYYSRCTTFSLSSFHSQTDSFPQVIHYIFRKCF
jgi:hypothetical protein